MGREVKSPRGGFTLMEDGHLVDLVVIAWLAPEILRGGGGSTLATRICSMCRCSKRETGGRTDGRTDGRAGGWEG